MKLNEFYEILNGLAPKALSDAFCAAHGAYDNSGILVETGADVTGALFSLDLSSAAIGQAKRTGKNLIVTHHPAIYAKLGCLGLAPERDPLNTGANLMECVKNGISVASMHLNLDCADGGIDESLKEGVLLAAARASGKAAALPKEERMIELTSACGSGAYGRAYTLPECDFEAFLGALGEEFCSRRVSAYANGRGRIGKAASFCGAGADEEALGFAIRTGADVMISSDFKHHILAAAKERGIAVIALTHYASEHYGFKKYYDKIRRQTDIPCELFTDEDLL